MINLENNMNSSIPMVSILVPLYNHEKYIVECLNSLINQTYKNIEIIITNDGSTDSSDLLVKEWIKINNTKIDIYYNTQENCGIVKTLNKMINMSNGKYIALCASDDALTPQSISLRVDYLNNNKNKLAVIGDAEVIGTNSEFINKSAMKSLYYANYNRLKTNIIDELVINWSVVGPTFLAKKKLYMKIGLYDDTLKVEDREFYLRLLAKDYLGFLPYSIAKYRIHTQNISRKNKESVMSIYYQIAISNLKHANSFKGINKFFLKSHIVDLYVARKKFSKLNFYILYLFRGIRKVISRLFLVNS